MYDKKTAGYLSLFLNISLIETKSIFKKLKKSTCWQSGSICFTYGLADVILKYDVYFNSTDFDAKC